MILAAKVTRGPELAILDHFAEISKRYASARDLLDDFNANKLPIPGAPIDMNIVFPYIMDFSAKLEITYVTKDLNPEEVKKMGFHYASSVQAAIDACHKTQKHATVNIYSLGGLVIPLNDKCLL